MKQTTLFSIFLIWAVFIVPGIAEWQSLQRMPTPRSEMSAAILDGKIYVPGGLGGLRTFEAYSIAADSWENLAPLPGGRHHLMTVAHGNKFYVFGGGDENWQPHDSAWSYDVDRDRWQALAAMPEARFAGAAVALGDFIYVVGGTGPSGRTLRYDPKLDRWTRLKSTRRRREHIAAVVIEGKILVIGGRFRDVGEFNSTEIYDPARDEWRDGPALGTARGGHAAVLHLGGVLVFGGEVIMQPSRKTLGDSERLERLSGAWRKSLDLPLPLHGMAAASQDRAVYILGGSQRAGTVVNRGGVYRHSGPGTIAGQRFGDGHPFGNGLRDAAQIFDPAQARQQSGADGQLNACLPAFL